MTGEAVARQVTTSGTQTSGPGCSRSCTELASRAQAGDRAAYGELYERLAPTVAAVARRTIGDRDVVGDVVQDTFTRGLERLAQIRDVDSFPAWIAGIAKNASIDAVRSHRRFIDTLGELADRVQDPVPGPDHATEVRDDLDAVLHGVALLSTADALIVTVVGHLGLTTSELARLLGIEPSAAKVRLHRARRRLAHILDARSPWSEALAS